MSCHTISYNNISYITSQYRLHSTQIPVHTLIQTRLQLQHKVVTMYETSIILFCFIHFKSSSSHDICFIYAHLFDFFSSFLSENLNIKIYRITILPAVLYGCETWSLTLREERRLRVYENRVLGRIFGAMRDEVTGEWRKLHNEELNDLYWSPIIVRVTISRIMRWAGHVARMGEKRGVYSVLVGKPEGRRPLGRPRRRWEDNIKMDLQKVRCEGKDWIELALNKESWRVLVNAVMNLRVP